MEDTGAFLDANYFQHLRSPDQRQRFVMCVAEAVPAWKEIAAQLASI